MSSVFVSMADQAYGSTQVIGVNTTKQVAEKVCREAEFADDEKTMPYDRHWIEEWVVGGSYVRTYHLIENELVEMV